MILILFIIDSGKKRIPPLANYAHQNGLKFGLYSDAGTHTCQGRPGSLGYETNDATSYASWGVDYLKYDNCHNQGISAKIRYPPMRDALAACGRPIFFSMCEWGRERPAEWAEDVATSWRTTEDIKNYWVDVMHNIDVNDLSWKYAAPGGWNDPDMLECPNPGNPHALTESEFRVHFTLWALAKAPLIIGCDLDTLSAETLAVLKNKEVIAVTQDPLGIQGYLILRDPQNETDVWSGPVIGYRFVVALVNRNPNVAQNISFSFSEIGIYTDFITVRDIYLHEDLGVFSDPFMTVVNPRSVVALIVSPS